MKIKPLEWLEQVNTETQKIKYTAFFFEIGGEYCLGFEIEQGHIKYHLKLQNYNNGSDYHGLGNFGNLETAKNAAQGYANETMNDIMERFVVND